MKLKPFFILSAALAFTTLTPSLVQAQQKSITTSEAQGLKGSIPTITVWPGSGVNLNFIPTGEIIKKVWLDDPSKIALDFDGPMCLAAGARGGDCGNSAATVVHLRRINGLDFPYLPRTESTLLTVITQGAAGRHLYQFRVVPGTGKPQYSTLVVKSDAFDSSARMVATGVASAELSEIVRGFQIAVQRGQISPNGPLSSRLKNFLVMVRNGYSLPLAAQRAGISMAVVQKLAQMGTMVGPRFQPPLTSQPTNSARPASSPTRK